MIAEQRDKRSQALQARRSMSAENRAAASVKISEKIIRSHEFFAAKTVACYLPMRDEVDPAIVIERAWRANKRVFCPVIGIHGDMIYRRLDRDTILQRSDFGLWEPTDSEFIPPRQLDLVVTPLVAFDEYNNRIGMGGGYFDRCFSFLKSRKRWKRPKLMGAAFKCQEVEKIDANPWDIPLYSVVHDAS
ncbi:MAG: 5-formyltetrahydrofolate cyclo-ligase [Woeseiaceae bacterium]